MHNKGLINKLGIIIGVLLGAITDMAVSDEAPIFYVHDYSSLCLQEALSIIENLAVIGVPLAQQLKNRLVQESSTKD